MAKNRNNKKRNGVVSMDTTDASVSEQPQAMDTSESRVQNAVSGATNMKMKQKGRPMKRSKNVRKMKAIAKAVSSNEKSIEKVSKNENKRSRVKSAKSLYE
ncbi:uncharacterized protein LOC124847312 isoform X2 [Vigna umbellata]|uniref:Uncharacterized protein n=2 Tax=Phaseolus angularis TaxID=3914 RepID=A0A0L9ULU8_PHAAN|nr:uncharacterized protein LOC108332532 [Vigna angularis]XP_047180728.1 uncharacterized protein LOC124847312 isoform X2 [Vigna umbellata]KAG2371897.1 uncharacterized protein HKW66_Vig0240180 [Vigna angularis]KOM43676.1 hypothetical protein LR48_Vigan05g128100 [Vigna angularis]BAT92504.1 hypothetical protein VIGAN_07123700 [Vigna angularis var. angularis]